MEKSYVDTVRLMLEVAPEVFASGRVAMKGGTALNFFVQDLPRLSVDIDVVFVPHQTPRDTALAEIASAGLSLSRFNLESVAAASRANFFNREWTQMDTN